MLEEEKKVPDNTKQDSGTTKEAKTETSLHETVFLKETVLNPKTVIDNKRISAGRLLNAGEINRLSLKSIDSTASGTSFKYHLIDTLFSSPEIDIYLIGREYTEENILWVASYDKHPKLLDYLIVYYDNSEGFLSIGSVIKNNMISVSKQDEYADTTKEAARTDIYYFNEANKLVKQR